MSEENERLCLEAFCPYLRHHLTLEHMDDLAFNFHLAELFSEGEVLFLVQHNSSCWVSGLKHWL